MVNCVVCGKVRKPGDFYYHRDKYPIKLHTGKEVHETEICIHCLYEHMAEYYPGSPNHKHLAFRLGKDIEKKQMDLFAGGE